MGLWLSTTAQKSAANGVLQTAIADEEFFQKVLDTQVLIIQDGPTESLNREKPNDPDSSPTKNASSESYNIAADFGELFEKNDGLGIYDISRLPHPKRDIRDALFDIYRSDTDHERKELVKTALFELTNYQNGVGDEPVRGFPDFAELSTESDPEKLATSVLEKYDDIDEDRYQKLREIAKEEYEEYKRQLEF